MHSPRVVRHESPSVHLEMAWRAPHPLLRDHVRGYSGWSERRPGPVRRREVPTGAVTVVIGFGDELTVLREGRGRPGGRVVSYVTGLHDSHLITEHAGRQSGIEVALTPLGAYGLLGLPQAELTNTVVPLEDVIGAGAVVLAERLASEPGWAERFRLLDRVFAGRRWLSPHPSPEVTRVWDRLSASAGRARVEELAADVGWSRRHLAARFREQVGLPPKAVGGVLRFQRALRLLAEPAGMSWAEVATACGYYDQAHLNRDVRELTGLSPGRLLGARPRHAEHSGADVGDPVDGALSHLRLPRDIACVQDASLVGA